MGNASGSSPDSEQGYLVPKPNTSYDILDNEEIETLSRSIWSPQVDYLKKQNPPIDNSDISIQNCSNLGINVGSESSPYNLCMCSIATHGAFEETPLDRDSGKQTFVVPKNAMVFVFSAAAPGYVSIGNDDSGPPKGSRMSDLFPNVYRPIDRNFPPIPIAEARHKIKHADKDHIMNTKISAIRDCALNFTYMDEENIRLNLMRLSDALRTQDYNTQYLPLKDDYTSKEKTPGYVFTPDDILKKGYLDAFLTSNPYSVRQYNPDERMYIKKYTVDNKDRGANIDYSYDWNIFELFSGCNLTKFLSRVSRSGRNYVTNQTIIEHCAAAAASNGIRCVIILFDLACSIFTHKGYMVVDTSEITTLQGNVNGKMDAGGARNKRKHITHRKKNIKNRKINIKHKKRVTRKNKIFKRVY
jgi:hypothetical protein